MDRNVLAPSRCLALPVGKAARLTPPQAGRYAKGTKKHRSCVPGLAGAVDLSDTALSTSFDGTSQCSSSRLEVTDKVKEAWRRLPCPLEFSDQLTVTCLTSNSILAILFSEPLNIFCRARPAYQTQLTEVFDEGGASIRS
jgi:hypothetical protein